MSDMKDPDEFGGEDTPHAFAVSPPSGASVGAAIASGVSLTMELATLRRQVIERDLRIARLERAIGKAKEVTQDRRALVMRGTFAFAEIERYLNEGLGAAPVVGGLEEFSDPVTGEALYRERRR